MHPYPDHLVQRATLADGTAVTIRPIRPEDGPLEQAFVRNLSRESRYFRFMDAVRELSPGMLAHFTRIDYDRHMALIAVASQDSVDTQVAVARYVANADRSQCEFAIVVADAWQRRGLGTALLRALMQAARAAGVRVMVGEVLPGNNRMLRLAAHLGFAARFDEADPHLVRVEAELLDASAASDAASSGPLRP